MSSRNQRAQIGQMLAGEIETSNRHKKPIRFSVKNHSRWQSGICGICGRSFRMITQEHAHLHGFANADAMAKSNEIHWRD